jgi:hypothetical protein
MSDNHIRDERLGREMGDQDDPALTTRVSWPGGVAEESKPAEPTAAEPTAAEPTALETPEVNGTLQSENTGSRPPT